MLLCIEYAMLFVHTVDMKIKASNALNCYVCQDCKTDDIQIIGGDFKKPWKTEIDTLGGGGDRQRKQQKASAVIGDFLDQNDWLDVWRSLHQEDNQFTYSRTKPICDVQN